MKLAKRTESHFRDTPEGMVLVANRSAPGAELQFPPSEFIHGDAVPQEVVIGPVGALYTYSIVHVARDSGPYGRARVDFEPGVRVFGRMLYTPGQEPALGSAMKVVPFTLPDGVADYAFQAVQVAAP